MGIRVKKHKGSWWVFVSYHGRRKAKKVGSESAARQVAAKLEVALACGDFTCLEGEAENLMFAAYAKKVLEFKAVRCKASTLETYQYNQEHYILPVFGERKLRSIKRDDIKSFLADLTKQKLSLNTIRLALAALRGVLSCALEDNLIQSNPALGLGSFTESEKPAHRAQSMEPEEARRFLEVAQDYCPDYYPLFLIALRAGLRQGEILGLRWGDFQFGDNDDDLNRYIFVQRRWYKSRAGLGTYSSPKNRKERRVDMSQELRRVLIELRDQRLLKAFTEGKETIAEDLVFPGLVEGYPVTVKMLEWHYQAVLEDAGLRRFRFHDLRHTFGSLLIQSGAPLPYVSQQMGHNSIRMTADIYIHLIRSGNIQWVDKLDSTQPETEPETQPNATQAQPKKRG